MARLTANAPFDMHLFLSEGSLALFFEFAEVVTGTSTRFVVRDEHYGTVEQLTLTGSFGNYVGGYPTTGTITGGAYSLNGTLFTFADASIPVADFNDYVFADDIVGLFVQMLDGNDVITGSGGGDILYAFDGNDTLDGRGGEDLLVGGFGSDRYFVNSAFDEILEESGAGLDTIFSTAGSYWLPTDDLGWVENLTYVGAGSFTGVGNCLNNTIIGGDGNDRLDGSTGADRLYGGLGNDIYYADNPGDRIYETSAAGGIDTVYSCATFALGNNVERLILTGTGAIRGIGNSISNVIYGNDANNVIDGRGGADQMRGGLGNDTYYVDNAGDTVGETSGAGIDQVRSSVTFSLSSNVERLALTGTAAVNGTGNGLDNVLTGNAAANVLTGLGGIDTINGGGGNDTLGGGAGNDRLTGGVGADKYVFDAALGSSNVDRIYDFNTSDDTIVVDQTVFAALAPGALSAAAFHTGNTAHDADDRLIFDSATGRLYYDADGTGAGAQVLFAQFAAGLALNNADFLVVS